MFLYEVLNVFGDIKASKLLKQMHISNPGTITKNTKLSTNCVGLKGKVHYITNSALNIIKVMHSFIDYKYYN